MFQFPGFQTTRRSALESELSALRREVAKLSRGAARYGVDTYEDTRRGGQEIYGELVDMFVDALPFARKKASNVERLARDNPAATAAVVGLVLVGLVASVVYSRR